MEDKEIKLWSCKIDIPIYGNIIYLYYGDPDAFIDAVKKEYKCTFDNFDGYCEGYCAFLEKSVGKYTHQHILFYIKGVEIAGNKKKIHTIHHEAIHAAWFILDNAGIKLSEDNHEPLTYLEGFIAEKVDDIIEKWKKRK